MSTAKKTFNAIRYWDHQYYKGPFGQSATLPIFDLSGVSASPAQLFKAGKAADKPIPQRPLFWPYPGSKGKMFVVNSEAIAKRFARSGARLHDKVEIFQPT